MAITNWYLGLRTGQATAGGTNVVIGTVSNGANSDVEVRIQTDTTTTRPITTKDVQMLLDSIKDYISNNGVGQSFGTDLPPL